MIFAMLLCALMAFAAAKNESIPLMKWIFGNTMGLVVVLLAIVALIILWFKLNRGDVKYIRLLAGFIVTMLLIAVTYAHFPDIVLLKSRHDLSLLNQNTPEKTIHILGVALLMGSCLILPSLIYLVYSFHKKDKISQN